MRLGNAVFHDDLLVVQYNRQVSEGQALWRYITAMGLANPLNRNAGDVLPRSYLCFLRGSTLVIGVLPNMLGELRALLWR